MIRGEESGAAGPFEATPFDVSARAETSASVAWTLPATSGGEKGLRVARTPGPRAGPPGARERRRLGTGSAVVLVFSGEGSLAVDAFEGEPPTPPASTSCWHRNRPATRPRPRGCMLGRCCAHPVRRAGILLVLASLARSASAEVLDLAIAAGSDDVEETGDGSLLFASGDLALGAPQLVGLRFTGVAIPPDQVVTAAWLQLRADEPGSAAAALSIQGEAVADAAPFVRTDGSLSARPRTTAAWRGPCRRGRWARPARASARPISPPSSRRSWTAPAGRAETRSCCS